MLLLLFTIYCDLDILLLHFLRPEKKTSANKHPQKNSNTKKTQSLKLGVRPRLFRMIIVALYTELNPF